MSATFYAVGVGPGDPELITLKALRILRECDLIGVPADDPSDSHAYRILLQAAPELASRPILKLPTPMTKDSASLEQSYRENASLVTQALTQGSSAACTLQESLGTRDEAIHILPGSYPVEESLSFSGTKIILKSAGSYPQVRELLEQKNLRASLVVRCGQPEEQVYTDLKDFPEKTEYLSLIIAK